MKKRHFNLKTWAITWTVLGSVGLFVPVVMVLDARFDENSILIPEKGQNTTQNDNTPAQTTSQLIQSYYKSIHDNVALANSVDQALFPSNPRFSSISSVAQLNGFLTNETKIPNLPAELVGIVNVKVSVLPANDDSGILQIKIILQESGGANSPFKTDGEIGTSDNSGKTISITGFRSVDNLATQWYTAVAQVFANNTMVINDNGKNITSQEVGANMNIIASSASSDAANAINQFASSQIPNFPLQLANTGFKPVLSNITPNDDGSLGFKLSIVDAKNNPVGVSVAGHTTDTGLNLTLTGAKSGSVFTFQNSISITGSQVGDPGNWYRWRINIPGVSTPIQAQWYLQAIVHYGYTQQFIDQIVDQMNATNELTAHPNGYIVTFNPLTTTSDYNTATQSQFSYSQDGSTLVAGGHGPAGSEGSPAAGSNGMTDASKFNGIEGIRTELNNLLSLSTFRSLSANNPYQTAGADGSSIVNQQLSQNYYAQVGTTYPLVSGSDETQKVPVQSSLTTSSTLDNINALISTKLPQLPANFGIQSVLTPDNDRGNLKVKLVLTTTTNGVTTFYNTNGTTASDVNSADGKTFEITGYNTLSVASISYYGAINSFAKSFANKTSESMQTIVAALQAANAAPNVTGATPSSPVIDALNKYSPTALTQAYGQVIDGGYKLNISNIVRNYATNSITFNLRIVNDQGTPINATTGLADSSYAGVNFTMTNVVYDKNNFALITPNGAQGIDQAGIRTWQINFPELNTVQLVTWYLQAIVAHGKTAEFKTQLRGLFQNNDNNFANGPSRNVYRVSFNPTIINASTQIPEFNPNGSTLMLGGHGPSNSNQGYPGHNGINGSWKLANFAGMETELDGLFASATIKTVTAGNPFAAVPAAA
ncbi:hypothetical protein [[Mycoplasma] testudinis]|uniref:hypothetical protein n=1 Tax=[Mycoplasma] testudinis TaxID=33924 RepID=UPI0004873CAF|nr:hypothetical protein [[Mycoplasma] testudinis]